MLLLAAITLNSIIYILISFFINFLLCCLKELAISSGNDFYRELATGTGEMQLVGTESL